MNVRFLPNRPFSNSHGWRLMRANKLVCETIYRISLTLMGFCFHFMLDPVQP